MYEILTNWLGAVTGIGVRGCELASGVWSRAPIKGSGKHCEHSDALSGWFVFDK